MLVMSMLDCDGDARGDCASTEMTCHVMDDLGRFDG